MGKKTFSWRKPKKHDNEIGSLLTKPRKPHNRVAILVHVVRALYETRSPCVG
jgi:hypothetical protein